MGVGQDVLNSFLGNTESAYLVVDDYRALCTPVQQATVSQGLAKGLSAANALKEGVNSALATAAAVKQSAAAALSDGVPATSVPTGCTKKYFKVQFNPSEMSLNGMLEHEEQQDTQANDGQRRTVTNAVVRPTITLSVNLYFDAMSQSDAFMAEKFTSGLSVQTAVNAVSMLSGKVYSVQPQVEALIAALRNNYTRTITFYWGKFSFIGQLSQVGAQYTMFSTSGRPIRAVVALRIIQELDPTNVNSWYSEFSSTFKNGSSSLVGAAQKVGNLFNLNL